MKRIATTIIMLSVCVPLGCRRAGSPPPQSGAEAPGAECHQSSERILDIAGIRQIGSNWCWAASGEMVMGHYETRVRQCEQVNARYQMTKCCDEWFTPECNLTGWPEFERYNFTYRRTDHKALGWDQIKEQIACRGNPVAFTWKWPGGSGHMMVIHGFRTVDGVNYLLVNDPNKNPQNKIIRYEHYVRSPGNHEHWDDFYDFRKQGDS